MYSQMINYKCIVWKEESSYKLSVKLDLGMNWDTCATDIFKNKMWCLHYKFSYIKNNIYNMNLGKNNHVVSVILSVLIFGRGFLMLIGICYLFTDIIKTHNFQDSGN